MFVGFSKEVQFLLFEILINLQIELVEFNSTKTEQEISYENLDERITLFLVDVFKTIHAFSLRIDFIYNLKKDFCLLELAKKLMYRIELFFQNFSFLKLNTNSDIMYECIHIMNVNLTFSLIGFFTK